MNYDAIIIGGSVGGSTAGSVLAMAGKRVLILERETFPRFHIGESLIPFGNDVLREIGAWDKIANGGFMPKLGAEFTLNNSHGFTRIWFRENQIPERSETFQVERSRFDKLLLDNARENGCEVREAALVQNVEFFPDKVSVRFRHSDVEQEAEAPYVIDASGRDAFLGKKLGLSRSDLNMKKKIATYGHFTGVYRNDGEAYGHITIVRLPNGWYWIIPLDAEKTSIGLVAMIEDVKASGLKPEEYFWKQVKESPEMQFRMQHGKAELQGSMHITSDYTYRHHVCAGDRWILAGDAAGFIDPVFSSGVMVALRTGRLAARTLLKADAKPLSAGARKEYTKEVHKMTGVFLRLIRMFYDNDAFAVFMNRRPTFGLAAAVNSLVAGHTDHDLSMRLRVWAFYLICYLQRWREMVPRVSFALPAK